MTDAQVIFSIGHSNHDLDRFLELLEAHEVEVVADVRTTPFSRYNSHFNRDQIAGALSARNLKYLFLGDELGGRPDGRELYDQEGHVRYDLLAETDLFGKGVARLLRSATENRVAMFCSEGDPAKCHRHLLIARVLHARGIRVLHIEPDGTLNDYQFVAERTSQPRTLFAGEEDRLWRSPLSVLQSTAQSRSSES